MATRGRIGMVLEDGKVASIYQHWDSYPTGLGETLVTHYTNKAKVEKLIALGDCSSVREEVDIPEGKTHTFDNPLENVTVAYGRDRGETGIEPRLDDSVDEYVKSDVDNWGYLFKDNKWYVVNGWAENRKLIEITLDNLDEVEMGEEEEE